MRQILITYIKVQIFIYEGKKKKSWHCWATKETFWANLQLSPILFEELSKLDVKICFNKGSFGCSHIIQ
jgi:hypothetical protein